MAIPKSVEEKLRACGLSPSDRRKVRLLLEREDNKGSVAKRVHRYATYRLFKDFELWLRLVRGIRRNRDRAEILRYVWLLIDERHGWKYQKTADYAKLAMELVIAETCRVV